MKIAAVATLEDLLAIPEEARRHELIDGVIGWPGGWWFATEVDVYFDPGNTFRPDVAGWRRERCPEPPRGPPVMLRPDWVCEILSTNRRNALVKKKRTHHRHQVPHYWIVDPAEETLSVYRWAPEGYRWPNFWPRCAGGFAGAELACFDGATPKPRVRFAAALAPPGKPMNHDQTSGGRN